MICHNCSSEFETPNEHRTHCPRCNDVRQGRPTAVLDRNEVWAFSRCRIVSLPGEWQHMQARPGDRAAHKIVFRGCDLDPAASQRSGWTGRIDLFSKYPWPATGERVARVALVETRHATSADSVETRTYLRVDAPRRSLLADIYEGEVALPMHLMQWYVSEAPVEPLRDEVWRRDVSNGALFGALIIRRED